MSYQMAASWGYFNCSEYQWNTNVLGDAGFPTEFLPELKAGGDMAGHLVGNWYSIPEGTPIGMCIFILQYIFNGNINYMNFKFILICYVTKN